MKTKTVHITHIAYGGMGVARLDGKVCFVEGALQGEEVEIEITKEKKNFSEAKVLRLIKPSKERIDVLCAHADLCGGCQYLHMSYTEELKWKEIQVREYFKRMLPGKEFPVSGIQPTANEHGYRNQVTLHRDKTNQYLGFYAKDNTSVVPIKKCLLADARLNSYFQAPPEPSLSGSLTLRVGHQDRIYSDQDDSLFQIELLGRAIWTHSKSFFQNNLEVTENILKVMESSLRQYSNPNFIDLYAGVGTFSFFLQEQLDDIVCAENNPYSLKALERNFENFERNCYVLEGNAEDVFPSWLLEHGVLKPTVLFLDPPRTGLAPDLAAFLAKNRPVQTVYYLSCHLGSLTRDLGILTQGGYTIKEAYPFDMFPRTKHIEILTVLTAP